MWQAPKVQSRPTSAVSTEAHVEPQFEGGEVENQPEVRADVARESDRNDSEELPESGLCLVSLVSLRLQMMQMR